MAKKKYTEEEEKQIALLQAENEMLKKSIDGAMANGREDSARRIEIARKDVLEQLAKIDPELAKEKKPRGKKKSIVAQISEAQEEDETVFHKNEEEKPNDTDNFLETFASNTESDTTEEYHFGAIDSDVQYDIISLPSNGEGYKTKMNRVPVAYLTAYDENFITSPNLYKDGLIIDFLLHNKVLNKDIDVEKLYSGDVDAIILWLRATSYGVDFPITVKDPDSGERFDTTIDLTTLKYKEFSLKGDENGYFDFELPVSKDKVKFKFFTRKDERDLKVLNALGNDSTKAIAIEQEVDILSDIVESDTSLPKEKKTELTASIKKFTDWAEELKKSSKAVINKTITNRMEMSIVSINGNDDRKYISKYVKNMGAKDSLAYRRYYLDNEPGVDFEIEVERPQNLGGGSFKTFLEWDDTVFLNIPGV